VFALSLKKNLNLYRIELFNFEHKVTTVYVQALPKFLEWYSFTELQYPNLIAVFIYCSGFWY